MTATIIDGKALAKQVRLSTAEEVAALRREAGAPPGLSVVLVGDDPASHVYVRNKQKACAEAGMDGRVVRLAASTTQPELEDVIDQLNADAAIHGILVQLPLPKQIDEHAILERVNPLKDVDGFHPVNAGLLAQGNPRFVPCTPLGIQHMLIQSGVETRGANAVVLGRSNIVGKPMALLLMSKGPGGDSTVTVCHTATRDAQAVAREADLLIVAMGRPERIDGGWIKPGATVIDVGIHRTPDGRLCGDVDFAAAAEIAGKITPVPGGVGPLTIAMLLRNTLQAARMAHGPNPLRAV